jgi:hypothetical protein
VRFSTLVVVFHQTIPSRALIHRLKPFRRWLRIRRDSRNNRLQRGLNETAGSVFMVSMSPRDQFPPFQGDRDEYEAIFETALACGVI